MRNVRKETISEMGRELNKTCSLLFVAKDAFDKIDETCFGVCDSATYGGAWQQVREARDMIAKSLADIDRA